MKTLLSFLIAVTTLSAQDYSKLPELPVWYELVGTSYGQYMNYIQNFDTARGGINALIHYHADRPNDTWYNRFMLDTANMFQWTEPFTKLFAGDFNGDGITDYYTSNDRVYQGIANGKPPKLPYVASGYGAGRNTSVLDVNSDGKMDIVYASTSVSYPNNGTSVLGRIVLGNEDLTKMKILLLPRGADRNEFLINAYTIAPGKVRLVVWSWDNDKGNSYFTLYGTSLDSNNNLKSYDILDRKLMDVNPAEWLGRLTMFFHERNKTQHTMIVPYYNVYSLDKDKFDLILTEPDYAISFQMTQSIQNPQYPGWLIGLVSKLIIADTNYRLCMGGDPQTKGIPIARVKFQFPFDGSTTVLQEFISIGDINGDSLGDFAAHYDGFFRIYLGVVGTLDKVDELEKDRFALSITNPIRQNAPATITVTALRESDASIELYNLRGALVGVLWQGRLLQGFNPLTIDLRSKATPAGMYNLRLKIGAISIDKALIIE